MDTTWRRLCDLLGGGEQEVWEAVSGAIAAGDDPWEALLDGLDEVGALAYLQADDTGMELTDALAQLPLVFAAQPDLDTATDTDDLVEATLAADAALRGDDLRIVRLVEADDAWPVVVVPAGAAADVAALAAEVGHLAVLTT